MYLFINYPEDKFEVESLIKEKKSELIRLEVKEYDPNLKEENIVCYLSNSLRSKGVSAEKISLIIFHPAGIVGMVNFRMIPIVVKSIKQWLKVPLITISRGGRKDYLDPAKEAGSDVALSINEFYRVWKDCSGNESMLLSWLEDFVGKKKVENILIEIVTSFLPLSIDMQALEIIKDNPEKVKKYLWGDKDIEGMLQNKEEGFLASLKKAQYNKIDQIYDTKYNIKKLLGLGHSSQQTEFNISDFLSNLDYLLKNGDSNSTKINQVIENAEAFNEWYRKLNGVLASF